MVNESVLTNPNFQEIEFFEKGIFFEILLLPPRILCRRKGKI